MAQLRGLEEKVFIDPGYNNWNLEKDIHIWKFPAVNRASALLTEEEQIFSGRFRFTEDRNRFSTGRHALRLLLSKYLSIQPGVISISAEMGEKPVLNFPASEIQFNLSHSGEWVLVAFAKEGLGIDVELIDRDFEYDDLLPEHFNEQEQAFVSTAEDPATAFYYLWTRKEALTKAWGTGLQENLKGVTVLENDESIKMKHISWKLASFQISPLYPVAIAYSGAVRDILYFDGTQAEQ